MLSNKLKEDFVSATCSAGVKKDGKYFNPLGVLEVLLDRKRGRISALNVNGIRKVIRKSESSFLLKDVAQLALEG